MKTLSLLIGLLAVLTVINFYSFLMEEYDTKRQALIAGGLTGFTMSLLIVLILKGAKSKSVVE